MLSPCRGESAKLEPSQHVSNPENWSSFEKQSTQEALLARCPSTVTPVQRVPGDAIPWPEREVSSQNPFSSLPPQAAHERPLRSYYK